jgi:iron complex transport system substrate-binding protein
MSRIPFLLLCCIVFTQCIGKADKRHNGPDSAATDTIRYARGFNYRESGNCIVITVKDPWQQANGIRYHYMLSDTFPASGIVDEFTCRIKTPVKNVVCLSTTHIGFIGFLEQTASVTGISGRSYVVNETLRARLDSNLVADVGYDENLNYELLLKLKPDVVFAYGINSSVTNTIIKLTELGIPVVMIGEYLEKEPLAKMEWLKVFAAFYDLEEDAAVKFDSVATRYEGLRHMALKAGNKPSVLLGLPWRGTWYVSGSQSYVAHLITDAGGKYLWEHLDYNESRPMALEKVYEFALSADFWLNPGEARSKSDVLAVDERFGKLPSYKNDKLFNNNNVLNSAGGNAFFESGVVEPDIILSDLIYILHPQLLPSHKLKYYRKLQ